MAATYEIGNQVKFTTNKQGSSGFNPLSAMKRSQLTDADVRATANSAGGGKSRTRKIGNPAPKLPGNAVPVMKQKKLTNVKPTSL